MPKESISYQIDDMYLMTLYVVKAPGLKLDNKWKALISQSGFWKVFWENKQEEIGGNTAVSPKIDESFWFVFKIPNFVGMHEEPVWLR